MHLAARASAVKVLLALRLAERRGQSVQPECLRLMMHEASGRRRLLDDREIVQAGSKLSMVMQLGGRVGQCQQY